MKLGTAPLPLDLFRDNASFVLYSSDVVAMEPYVTAEISMSRYDATRTYLLGSLESNVGLNDNAKYLNGPLNQSTTYTVLVWGFSPVPLVGAISMLCCCCCCCCHYTTVQCPLLLLLLLSLVHYSVLCCYCYTCCTFVVVVVLVCCCCCCAGLLLLLLLLCWFVVVVVVMYAAPSRMAPLVSVLRDNRLR